MKKTIALGYMTWKKGQWCAYQMLPLFNWGMTNQGIVLKTTLMNNWWAIEEREWELDKNLLKERSLCLESLGRLTYEMLIRRGRERGVPGTCQHVSVRGSSGEEEAQCAVVWMQCQWKRKTYEGLLNCSYVRSDTVYRCWVVKRRSWENMNWLRVRNIKWEDSQEENEEEVD